MASDKITAVLRFDTYEKQKAKKDELDRLGIRATSLTENRDDGLVYILIVYWPHDDSSGEPEATA